MIAFLQFRSYSNSARRRLPEDSEQAVAHRARKIYSRYFETAMHLFHSRNKAFERLLCEKFFQINLFLWLKLLKT